MFSLINNDEITLFEFERERFECAKKFSFFTTLIVYLDENCTFLK